MKRIAVVSTGGTIAMQAGSDGLAMPALAGEDLLSNMSYINEFISTESFSFKNIPSSHLTLQDLMELRSYIIDLKKRGFDGIVVTHGTDTLEETAYFLDITVEPEIPVVITGAQRNPSLISPDGPLNLMDSILTAGDDASKGLGTLIVFASEIMVPREAAKLYRTRTDAFKSLEFGPIGAVNNNRVIYFRHPVIRDSYSVGKINKRVDIITSYIGADSSLILSSIEGGAEGIVIDALGAGHVPPAMVKGIKEAIDKNIPVVLTSRAPIGRLLTDTYGYDGGERQLKSIGVIFGEDLSAYKARIKTIVLLSLGLDYNSIRHEFEKYFYE